MFFLILFVLNNINMHSLRSKIKEMKIKFSNLPNYLTLFRVISIPIIIIAIIILQKPALKALQHYENQLDESEGKDFVAADLSIENTDCWAGDN